MTFETDLQTVLAAVTPRVYPDFAPAKTARPYCTFQQIGGRTLNMVANVAPGVRNSMLQVNVWSDTRMEAMQIMRAIEDAMCTSSVFKATRPIAAAVCDYDPDIPVYGARQDFTCWHTP